MNTQEIAKKMAVRDKLFTAEKYDLVQREYDQLFELIGYIPDPTRDIREFVRREMLFPKRWVTLALYDESEFING